MRGILVGVRDGRLILWLTSNQFYKSKDLIFLSCAHGMVPWCIDPDAWRKE